MYLLCGTMKIKEAITMSTFDYATWWRLHLRTAKGETFTPEEQALYQAGNDYLDGEEANLIKGEWSSLYTLRTQVDQLQQKHSDLLHRSSELDAEIALLEENIQHVTIII
jgi:hypothetical protein